MIGEYFNNDLKVTNESKDSTDIDSSTNDVLIDVNMVPEDKVSTFNTAFDLVVLNPGTMDWNKTPHSFREEPNQRMKFGVI